MDSGELVREPGACGVEGEVVRCGSISATLVSLDNLTHSLTGLMLARAGVGKGIPRATLLMVIAANAPDVDVASLFGGPLTYLEYHRWFTHSIVAVPLMAVLTVLFVRLFAKGRFPWIPALIAATVGVASHVVLDWTNMYGVRLMLPFSPEWYRLDITNIFDIWIWALLLLAVVAPALSRLVSSEIGAKSGTGKGWAIFALLLLCGYEYGRYLVHDRAVQALDARMYGASAPLRVAAFPNYANPFLWRGLVETPDAFRVLPVDLLREFDPGGGRSFYKAEGSRATIAASRTETFQRFLSFSPYTLGRTIPVPDPEGGTEVDAYDLRFGEPPGGGFVATAVVDRSGRVASSRFGFGRGGPR